MKKALFLFAVLFITLTIDLSTTCKSCLKIVSLLERNLENATSFVHNIIEPLLISYVCKDYKPPESCIGMIKENSEIVWASVIQKILNPYALCTIVRICPAELYLKLSLSDFQKEVLKDKPPTVYPIPTKKNIYKVAVFTDAHMDLEYKEGSNADCTSISSCCHSWDGVPSSPEKAARYWGTNEKCDIPARTIE